MTNPSSPASDTRPAARATASGRRQAVPQTIGTTADDDDPRLHRRSGVWYPVGHALLAYPDEATLGRALEIAADGGIADTALTRLDAAQVKEITDRSQHDAGLLARIVSAELKQLSILEQLAQTGHHFLLVTEPDDVRPALDRMTGEGGASKGLLYYTLAVEELPVAKETIPGRSPFGMNEVIRTQPSDANVSEGDAALMARDPRK